MTEPEILYEDKQQLKVIYDSKNGAYHLCIDNNSYVFLYLDELARSPSGSLTRKLDLINPAIVHDARQHGMTVDSIGMALAQARISELEKELSHAYSSITQK